MKDKRLNIRLTQNEKTRIINKANKSKMNISEFIIKSCLKDNIIIIDGIDKLEFEVRKIGNNINQLTRLAHEGRVNIVNLSEVQEELVNIWQLLKSLIKKQM